MQEVLNSLYALTAGIDYEQPTSLPRDLDRLTEAILDSKLCVDGFPKDPDAAVSLEETLANLRNPHQFDLEKLLTPLAEIESILGDCDYGNLRRRAARDLEVGLESFSDAMEKFLNEL